MDAGEPLDSQQRASKAPGGSTATYRGHACKRRELADSTQEESTDLTHLTHPPEMDKIKQVND